MAQAEALLRVTCKKTMGPRPCLFLITYEDNPRLISSRNTGLRVGSPAVAEKR